MEQQVNKYTRVFLPREEPAFEANLDELSRQGWELVAFIGGWQRLPQYHFREDGAVEQIEAVLRRTDNAREDRAGG